MTEVVENPVDIIGCVSECEPSPLWRPAPEAGGPSMARSTSSSVSVSGRLPPRVGVSPPLRPPAEVGGAPSPGRFPLEADSPPVRLPFGAGWRPEQ